MKIHLAERRQAGGRAFTLLEVILAIVLAVGILLVVLYFYQQSAELRTQLIEESERIAAARLVMDRLTSELRCVNGLSASRIAFAGTASSMRYVMTALPSHSTWGGGTAGSQVAPETDLKLVTYSLGSARDGTNLLATGLVRLEQATVETRPRATTTMTNESPAATEAKPAREEPGPEPMTDAIRFLRFRYWNGEDWQETWTEIDLPKAVEISLGGEPLPEKVEPDNYPFDLFRRVIYLPGNAVGAGLGSMAIFGDELMEGEVTP